MRKYAPCSIQMLLLASASPARRRLLEQAGIPHKVCVSGVDESTFTGHHPRQLVLQLAKAKAEAVLVAKSDGPSQREDPIRAVLGCDSVLIFEGEVFGKPRDAVEATTRWQRMAGGSGEICTGHCLLTCAPTDDPANRPERLLEMVTTRVFFAAVDDQAIEAYVSTGEPLGCAGGFALEGRGGMLIERLEGCYSNVIGLSLPLLRRWLIAYPELISR
jgi:septum formation protein